MGRSAAVENADDPSIVSAFLYEGQQVGSRDSPAAPVDFGDYPDGTRIGLGERAFFRDVLRVR